MEKEVVSYEEYNKNMDRIISKGDDVHVTLIEMLGYASSVELENIDSCE